MNVLRPILVPPGVEMAWFNSRPKGESRLRSVSKYCPILAMPTCSNMPTDEMTSNRSPARSR